MDFAGRETLTAFQKKFGVGCGIQALISTARKEVKAVN
jgi:hypothetical protein